MEVEGWFGELSTAASQWLWLVLVFTAARSSLWLVSSQQEMGRTENLKWRPPSYHRS